jgi:hypothetical protein
MRFELDLKNNTVFAFFPKGLKVDLEMAKQILLERLKLQQGKAYPLMLTLGGLISNTTEARKFMIEKGTEGISKGAIIVRKKYEEIVINVFLAVDKPLVPVKVFLNDSEALLWLNDVNR